MKHNTKKNRNLRHLQDFAKSFASSNILKNEGKINLVLSKEGVEKITDGACIRPDIFLDNDRTCDYCMYSENCVCVIKKFSKGFKHENNRKKLHV